MHLKSWVSFFFCSFFFTDYWLLQYTTGSRHICDMSQVHGKFIFLLFVFLYTYNFTYYSVNMDSRRILSLTTALMAWTGRERGREKERRRKRWGQWATDVSSPRYVFFLSLYLFLLTLTYRLLRQLRTATMSHTTQ